GWGPPRSARTGSTPKTEAIGSIQLLHGAAENSARWWYRIPVWGEPRRSHVRYEAAFATSVALLTPVTPRTPTGRPVSSRWTNCWAQIGEERPVTLPRRTM